VAAEAQPPRGGKKVAGKRGTKKRAAATAADSDGTEETGGGAAANAPPRYELRQRASGRAPGNTGIQITGPSGQGIGTMTDEALDGRLANDQGIPYAGNGRTDGRSVTLSADDRLWISRFQPCADTYTQTCSNIKEAATQEGWTCPLCINTALDPVTINTCVCGSGKWKQHYCSECIATHGMAEAKGGRCGSARCPTCKVEFDAIKDLVFVSDVLQKMKMVWCRAVEESRSTRS